MEETRTFELADIGERFIAIAIDSLIVGVVGGIFGASGNWWGGGMVGFVIGALYQWYFLTQQNGQTLGKKVMNIRVIKTDGTPINDAEAVLRFIGYYISGFVFALGYLWATWDPNSQTWHDKIANTYVIKVNKTDTIVMKEKNKNVL